eukprot:TRINITY_DN42162_c0_g1_i1.p1 TRINITY_DN42162_c0_g1~~TRINITY_DN42162_c0_g1_i1.p1  ORF type:complete len:506 (-),score=47.39 TRINITY_DN42162_c0_g1_i1:80-1597(-)
MTVSGGSFNEAGTSGEHARMTQEKRKHRRDPDEARVTVLSRCPSSPKWSLPGRRRRDRASSACKASGPGPGSYNVDSGRSRSSAVSFGGTGDRNRKVGSDTESGPGPAYNLRKSPSTSSPKKPQHCTFAGGRDLPDTAKDTPGPGDYHLRTTLAETGVKIAPMVPTRSTVPLDYPRIEAKPCRNRQERPSSAPAGWSFGASRRPPPGGVGAGGCGSNKQYSLPTSMRSHPAASCCTAIRPEADRWEVRPDSTTYFQGSESTLSRRSATIGKSKRPCSAPSCGTKDHLGPGSYEPRRGAPSRGLGAVGNRGNLGACSMRSSSRRDGGAVNSNETPGPGAHEAHALEPSLAFSIGKAPRPSLIREKSSCLREGGDPGPGEYAPKGQTELGNGGFPRFPARIDPEVEADRGSSRARRAAITGPGPGAFDVRPPRGAQRAATFGQAVRMPPSACDDIPGPGEYAVTAMGTTNSRGVNMGPKVGRIATEQSAATSKECGRKLCKAYSSFG